MKWNDNNMLVPSSIVRGTADLIKIYPGYEWIKTFPSTVYYALFLGWDEADLPKNFDYYVISFHREAVDLAWVKKQAKNLNALIFVLHDGNYYDVKINGVTFLPFYYWHYQLDKMLTLFGSTFQKAIKYKASAFCNRITQSKLYVFTALAKYLPESDRLITLSKWIEQDNIHNGDFTGNQTLDNLYDEFEKNWLGKEIKIDDFNNSTDNMQIITGNPGQPAYQECALHFTNESFHYSFMMDDYIPYTYPGPFITEKTLKCLLGATGFVPVGQFESYKTLESLGLNFNYDFDTAFDNDPGNLSRLESIVKLIQQLADMDTDQIFNATKDASEYNQHQIINGTFFKNCKEVNENTVETLHQLLA
jgi:hypothetical protein